MTVLMYTLGVVLFVVGIAVSIGLHEAGHMVTGKLFGVKVTQYFVGFGKTVWSFRRGETEYGIKAIPLGGYVKLIGMLPPGKGDEPNRVRRSSTGMFTQLISDARAAEYEHVEEGDEDRLFYRRAWWKKVIVMAAGVFVNLALAFALFGGVFMLHGVPVPTTTVDSVSDCVVAAVPGGGEPRACTPEDPVAPAKQAGLRAGDHIVSMNGTEITSWDQFSSLIRANKAGNATIVFERDGVQHTTTTNTTVSPRLSKDDPDQLTKVGFLGVAPVQVLEKQGPGYVLTTMGDYTWQTVKALGTLPVKVVEVAKAAIGLQERADDSPMSVVGASRVAGEVTSNDVIPLGDRLVGVLMLLGGINLFIGMLNLVPLLPLDGGHIAGALYEAVRRGLAKLLRRPDPGYFDVAKLLPVAYTMAGVILVVSVILIYADIVAPVRMG
ncbi:MAG TPA: site-2 protease family protein [Nocardioidaceae bacterium]|nr:site-2 protease family protein [Nocardioidaceae bacterium]